MADKKLNEVTKVTDMAYVPVIMSDGSIGQIAKADLASVVAELTTNKVAGVVDLNTLTENGMYRVSSGSTNLPRDESGFVIVYSAMYNNSLYVRQLYWTYDNQMYTRCYWSSAWRGWSSLTYQ